MKQQNKEYNRLYGYSLRLLGKREYSEYKLKEKLLKKQAVASSETIEKVLSDLKETSLLSDDRYAELYIRSRQRQSWGQTKIRHHLKQHGINSETISRNMEDYQDSNETINRLISLRLNNVNLSELSYEDTQKLKNKIYRYLLNRGFLQQDFLNELNKHFLID